jgi:hypothetical protein
MQYLMRSVVGVGLLLLVPVPAWAHADVAPHLHGSELLLVLATGAALAGLSRIRRFRSRK